jgi:hypothetical protein
MAGRLICRLHNPTDNAEQHGAAPFALSLLGSGDLDAQSAGSLHWAGLSCRLNIPE